MKKTYLTAALAAALSLTAAAQTKFDAYSLSAINYYKNAKEYPGNNNAVPVVVPFDMEDFARSGNAQVSLLVKLSPGFDAQALEDAGLNVTNVIGDICIATGNVDDIIALEDNSAVEAMQLSSPLRTHLDEARAQTGIDAIHNGEGLPNGVGFTGKGVVCGIFDNGIDPNHINFYDKDFTESRVRQFMLYPSTSGSPVVSSTPDAISKVTSDNKNDTHGTHTAGCMTGAFMLKGNKTPTANYPQGYSAKVNPVSNMIQALASNACHLYGPAYDADIVMGGGQLTNVNAIDAVSRIVDYAEAHNQPCVVNLSIGNNSGSHDGYGVFGQAMETLGKRAIICVSSGNEGDAAISIIKNFTASDNVLRTTLNLTQTSTGIIDIYGSDSNPFKFTVAVVNKMTGATQMQQTFNSEGEFTLVGKGFGNNAGYIHNTGFEDAFSTNSYLIATISDNKTTSKRRGIQIQYNLTNNSGSNSTGQYVIALFCEGSAGQRVDMVHSKVSGNGALISNGLAGYTTANSDLTINELACNKNVIAVGAWTTRSEWPTLSRTFYWFGQNSPLVKNKVSFFTSYGTLYDGRELPVICAPGAGIISSYNSYYTEQTDPNGTDSSLCGRYKYKGRNYCYGQESGTSMASPIAAGTVALWLEADPNLTVDKVINIMQKTADPLEGPAVQTGAGKLNALKGLKYILSNDAVNDITVDNNDIIITGSGNMYEVFAASGNVDVTVYNLNGQPVKTASAADHNLGLDLGSLNKGIYIINVNGVKSQRVAVN